MDINPQQQGAHNSRVEEGEKWKQYKGIRLRKWGKWVSEVRIPNCRAKIWLGSYATAEQAARAYDAAVFCLRGRRAKFNFPNSIPDIPSASSLSRRQIQVVAAKHAAAQIPSSGDWTETKSVLTEEVASPSSVSPAAEMEASSDSQAQSPWGEWESFPLWGDCDGNSYLDLESFPSFSGAAADVLPPLDSPGSVFFDPTDLWNL